MNTKFRLFTNIRDTVSRAGSSQKNTLLWAHTLSGPTTVKSCKVLIHIDINASDYSSTELILNHSNTLHLNARKFWADNSPNFPIALQMWLFWESLVTEWLQQEVLGPIQMGGDEGPSYDTECVIYIKALSPIQSHSLSQSGWIMYTKTKQSLQKKVSGFSCRNDVVKSIRLPVCWDEGSPPDVPLSLVVGVASRAHQNRCRL